MEVGGGGGLKRVQIGSDAWGFTEAGGANILVLGVLDRKKEKKLRGTMSTRKRRRVAFGVR